MLQDLVQRPELNGRLGEVETLHVTEDGTERAIVRLDGDGLQVSIKKVCLRRANRWAPTPWSTAQQRKDFFEKWRREISRNEMGTLGGQWFEANGQDIYGYLKVKARFVASSVRRLGMAGHMLAGCTDDQILECVIYGDGTLVQERPLKPGEWGTFSLWELETLDSLDLVRMSWRRQGWAWFRDWRGWWMCALEGCTLWA